MNYGLAILGGNKSRTTPFCGWPIFGESEEQRLVRALRSGKWGKLRGDEVTEFERRFAAMHGCKHGIAVVNGTVSLRIALLAAFAPACWRKARTIPTPPPQTDATSSTLPSRALSWGLPPPSPPIRRRTMKRQYDDVNKSAYQPDALGVGYKSR